MKVLLLTNFKKEIKIEAVNLLQMWWLLEKPVCFLKFRRVAVYLLLVYLVTALVPSDTACLESSPGR